MAGSVMVTKVTDGVWCIDCRTLDMPNVYVVDDGDCTLVDAGWPGDEETVRTGLHDAGFSLEDVDRVLLTHYDADHVGTLARLTPDLDAPVYVHEAERAYVAGERLPPWFARNGLEILHRLYYRRLTLPDLPVEPVRDGDVIGGFRAHHTPGHTPGHTVYTHEGHDAVFLGDLAYAIDDHLSASGRVTSYDVEQVEASTRTLLDRLTDVTHACPGHGPPLGGGYQRLSELVD